MFYEGKKGIDCVYRGREMERKDLGLNKLGVNSQVLLMEYRDKAMLKLGKELYWDFSRGSKRERMEIIAEILCYCNQQKTKTDIMHKTNLNYAQLKKHLTFLTSSCLLVADRNKYVTTQKGYRFLDLFVQLKKILTS